VCIRRSEAFFYYDPSFRPLSKRAFFVTPDRTESFEREAIPHLDAVYRFALRLTRSPADADDLVQETFLRGFRSWHRFALGTRAKSWLFTICRNAFVRQRQRERRRRELAEEAADLIPSVTENTPESRSPAPEPLIDGAILRRIDELPDDFRQVVMLCDVGGLPYLDVANTLAVPLGTVKSRLHRGRKILQGTLASAAGDHGITSRN
jgi:RNA polymerase sigma-70 factor, ECF subfamily